ncbi:MULTISPECIES: hypothetical protein [unclassified Micromonospora]|uniref:hypothetical protein n=1 Tax=unclassified Micromonospora TaxID=2617518 RepID=UPI0022B6A3D7|nr:MULTISPECIES: hypothetical protein [unclassified Micromonospora]MCZ7422917.1 hypothetical protein [Verrucosispora sp. WMMA2121]WBB90648.1 hypothetical protein O7597_27370 [Verrucosispora sp. WMMC514]
MRRVAAAAGRVAGCLPGGRRTAYLLAAGRMLVAADAVAPAEVRWRASARTLLAEIARGRPAPAGMARLTALAGLTR